MKIAGEFAIVGQNHGSKVWFVKYKISTNDKAADTRLEGKLASRAASVGLFKNENEEPYTSGSEIYMKILSLAD